MQVETLLVLVLLAGGTMTVDCVASPTYRRVRGRSVAWPSFRRESTSTTVAPGSTEKRARVLHQATATTTAAAAASRTWFLRSRRNRKRTRTLQPIRSTADDTLDNANLNFDSNPKLRDTSRSDLPPRLQGMVDRLDLERDLCGKSKLLVEIGDAFALTDSFTDIALFRGPTPPSTSVGFPAWPDTVRMEKVPGCVSEVYVAVYVHHRPSYGTLIAPRLPDDLESSGVVRFRGSADARVSRGILALLAQGLEGESPATVFGLRGEAVAAAIGMRAGLTSSRINGLGNILSVIQKQVRDQVKDNGQLTRATTYSSLVNRSDDDESIASAAACGAPRHDQSWRGGDALFESLPSSSSSTRDSYARAVAHIKTAETMQTIGGAVGYSTLSSKPLNSIEDQNDHTESRGNHAECRNRPTQEENASRWTPVPGAKDEVAVLLSGGVDSSVALRLLQDQGYRIRAFYIKIWLEDELAHLGQCPWEEDLSYATAVCEQAGVPLEVVPLQREYWKHVVAYTVREARKGRTPNPDVMCNSRIKFGMFYEHVGRHFRHVATGHYARLERDEDRQAEGRVRLLLSPDAVKDQTYFLCALNQAQLQKALFPVGAFTKERIRELAVSYNLPTKNRKDSQGICFLGKLKFDDFLRHYLGESPGPVLDRKTREVIGEHRGLWFHTIGQRKGIGPILQVGKVHKGPWFVSGKDIPANVLEVTNDFETIDGPRESFQVEALRWIAGHPPAELEKTGAMRMQVKTRHGPQMKDCSLRTRAEEARRPFLRPQSIENRDLHYGHGSVDNSRTEVECVASPKRGGVPVDGEWLPVETTSWSQRGQVYLGTKDLGFAPGQFAAFYLGDECLGSGVISESDATGGDEVGGGTPATDVAVTRIKELSATGVGSPLVTEESVGVRR